VIVPAATVVAPTVPVVLTDSMVTRAKTGVFKPKTFLAEVEPSCVNISIQNPKWYEGMMEEIHTWDLVPLPPHRKTIGSKWVYRLKTA
jgi:hypothetical protein